MIVPHRVVTRSLRFLTLSILTIPLLANQSIASDNCEIVTSEEVASAFSGAEVKLLHSDPSGICSWMLNGPNSLSVQIHVQPSSEDAKSLFGYFAETALDRLPRNVEYPKIGESAQFGITPQGSDHPEASLIVWKNDKIVVVKYYPRNDAELGEGIAASMIKLGHLSTNNAGKADQQYGQCEWLPESDLVRLLGKENRNVQRLGPNHCMASAQPGSASLTAMSDQNTTSRSFSNMRESIERSCSVVKLPEYGKSTYAFYDCENPGNRVMSVKFFEKGVHMDVSYKPAGRPATKDDLDAMKTLLAHVYNRLIQ